MYQMIYDMLDGISECYDTIMSTIALIIYWVIYSLIVITSPLWIIPFKMFKKIKQDIITKCTTKT